ncbi:PAS domain S-box protein [Natrinema longum]|uniref:histidine kinase n=1 Tax=Natrinema longum TaxID=370324 RepID=A0A8A2U8Y6_9EURY|nr:PAS domain S-box protein [Natrinema longum]MBZ6494267.1 PAS domain S-box protein [Natrinema longum]QSW84408.1 PAS domain S-box protein [Natrinema longum]
MSSRPDAADGGLWNDADPDVALQRYRTLVDTIDDGVYQLDADGRFVAVNDAVVEATGYPREELLDQHVSIVLADEDVTAIEREIGVQLATDGGEIPTFEFAIHTADDGRLPCELRINPLVDGEVFRGTIGVVRTRSEPAHRLRTLASAEAISESIANGVDDREIGVLILDRTFEIAWADETIEEYFDVDSQAIVGRDNRTVLEEILTERVADPGSFADTVLAAYDEGQYLDGLECRLGGDGDGAFDGRQLEYRSKPIESGAYAGGRIELYADITDRKRSEGALQESESAFHSLVDAVEEYAIFRLDRDGHVRSWNTGAEQIKGYDRAEILGEEFSTFYTEADRAANVPERNLERALEAGSIEDEGWRVRKDGTRFWATVTITSVRADDGTHRGYLKVTRDMTDRKERQQELESELQRVLGRVSDAFYAVDDEFRFTHVNDRAEDLLQRSEAELLGKRLWDVFPDLVDLDEVWDAFHTALETQAQTSYELYYDTLDFWVEANLYPSETGISVYFRDVTERRERERELEESEQRYRTLAEHFPNGIVTLFDRDLEYTLAAGKGFDNIPVEPADLEGEAVHDVWPDETAAALEPAFEAALAGEERSVELSYADREWVLHAVPITDSQGTVFAGVTMAHDITERKANQRKLEETVAQLEASNRRLEQFAYAASHDLQEPLRMVSSYLQLIERRYVDELDEEGEAFLEFAVDGADRMRAMIEGLLEYSRVETQGAPLEPVELDPLLESVLADLQIQIAETNAEVAVESLPRVRGDADQLRQLFQNLLSNALTYSGDEPPRIHIDADRRGREWELSVRDDGIGIESTEQDRVFEVFQRLHSREEHPGTGLGLALCQRIVERHGGEIRIDSEPGEGTTVSFTLPATETDDGPTPN